MDQEKNIEIGKQLYLKIKNALRDNKITQKSIAKELKISDTALSLQITSLLSGKGISTKTLMILERKTGVKFLQLD